MIRHNTRGRFAHDPKLDFEVQLVGAGYGVGRQTVNVLVNIHEKGHGSVSFCRAVSPKGFSRVAARGPRGRLRTPGQRRHRRF